MKFIADFMLLVGALFMFLGALGLMRMPDVYTRIQAGTKAATLGALALLIGVALHRPEWGAKLLLIALFILLTSPVGSSTIARAAQMIGIEPWRAPGDEEGKS